MSIKTIGVGACLGIYMYESHENVCQYLIPIDKQDTIVCACLDFSVLNLLFGELMVDIFIKDC